MKIKSLVISLGFLFVTNSLFAQQITPTTTAPTQEQIKMQMAQKGCQNNIGFLPTPSKLMCLLTALGLSEKDIKPKALAIVFSVCKGRTMQPPPAGAVVKAYPTLGTCLKDPAAISLINKDLKAAGFSEVKVVNPTALSGPKAASL